MSSALTFGHFRKIAQIYWNLIPYQLPWSSWTTWCPHHRASNVHTPAYPWNFHCQNYHATRPGKGLLHIIWGRRCATATLRCAVQPFNAVIAVKLHIVKNAGYFEPPMDFIDCVEVIAALTEGGWLKSSLATICLGCGIENTPMLPRPKMLVSDNRNTQNRLPWIDITQPASRETYFEHFWSHELDLGWRLVCAFSEP